ncbi:MAG: integrase/recombinase XerD [Lentimonas sp.]|jgi:integrase/recombinase XerD
MIDQYVPALRQRFLEDMQIKGLQPKTQTMYLCGMRDFTRFLRHAIDSATSEELRAFQRDMKERGVGAPTFNNRLTVLRCFLRDDMPTPGDEATHVVSTCSEEDPGCAERRGRLRAFSKLHLDSA